MGFKGKGLGETVYYTGASPLDSKLKPIANLTKLNEMINDVSAMSIIYPGMENVVLNYDTNTKKDMPVRFIVNTKRQFHIKDQLTVKKYSDIEQFKPYLLEGTKITVLEDETNYSQTTEYISETKTVLSEEGVESKEIVLRKKNNDGIIIDEENIIKKLTLKESGTLIYTQSPIYSYKMLNELSEEQTVYTFNLSEAEENGDFKTTQPGFYIIENTSNGEPLKIITGEEITDNTIYGNDVEEI
jgi:spore coat protein CotF